MGRLETDVLSVMETSPVVHEFRKRIAVHDILGNGPCSVVKGTFHPCDWVLVLPTGTALRMRPATEEDTGGGDPHGLVCIEVGEYHAQRIDITRKSAQWFTVGEAAEALRVDTVTSSRLRDAGLKVEAHLCHLTTRGWLEPTTQLSVIIPDAEALHWRYDKELGKDPWAKHAPPSPMPQYAGISRTPPPLKPPPAGNRRANDNAKRGDQGSQHDRLTPWQRGMKGASGGGRSSAYAQRPGHPVVGRRNSWPTTHPLPWMGPPRLATSADRANAVNVREGKTTSSSEKRHPARKPPGSSIGLGRLTMPTGEGRIPGERPSPEREVRRRTDMRPLHVEATRKRTDKTTPRTTRDVRRLHPGKIKQAPRPPAPGSSSLIRRPARDWIPTRVALVAACSATRARGKRSSRGRQRRSNS